MPRQHIHRLIDKILPIWPGDADTKVQQVLDATHDDFMTLVASDPISKFPVA